MSLSAIRNVTHQNLVLAPAMSTLQALANESFGLLPPGSLPEGIPQLNSGLDDVLSGSAKLAKARSGGGYGGGNGGISGIPSSLRQGVANNSNGSSLDGGA